MAPRKRITSPPTGMATLTANPSSNGVKSSGLYLDASANGNSTRDNTALSAIQGGTAVPDINIDHFAEYGLSGLKRMGGLIYEEFLPQLRNEKANRVYREMAENDPTISAVLFAIEMHCRMVDWRVDAASDSTEDAKKAQHVRQCMDDMSHTWSDFISECLTMLPYGFAPHEIVYKMRRGPEQKDPSLRSRYDDGQVGWRKLPLRAQDTVVEWVFDEDGGVKGFYQRGYPDWKLRYIPIEKSLLFRTTFRKNNPEGHSILRGAYRAWYFKKRMEEIEAIGAERDLAGLPMVTLPADIFNSTRPEDQAVLAAMHTFVKQVRNDERAGIVFPMAYDDAGNKIYDFSLVSTAGARTFDTSSIVQRYDERIAMTVLADFVFLGGVKGSSTSATSGSYAMSSDKTDMFKQALTSWLDSIADTFNRHAIPRLFELNHWPLDQLPKIAYEPINVPDLDTIGAFISNMMAAGWADILSDHDLRNFLLKRAELPVPNDMTEDKDRFGDVAEGETPDKDDVVFAGPTGVVRIKPDGKTEVDTAMANEMMAGRQTQPGGTAPGSKTQGTVRPKGSQKGQAGGPHGPAKSGTQSRGSGGGRRRQVIAKPSTGAGRRPNPNERKR